MCNFCNTKMSLLTEIETIRFSKDDTNLMAELKRLKISPHKFIRAAFREKIQRELKSLIEKEQREKNKIYTPF